MPKQKALRRVSKAEWLEAALASLETGAVSDLSVEQLARALGIAKSGFYWHFRDRRQLIDELLAHWAHELTDVVVGNPEVASLEPRERLIRTAEMIHDFRLNRYEIAFRQWALRDAAAARAVRRVNRARLDFVGQAFADLGFEGDELQTRTLLFVGYESSEGLMFPELSRKRRRELIGRRIAVLTA